MLEQFLITELFAFLLIFCRIGAGVMVMPGIGEAYVSPRIRLLFALMFSVLLVPLVGSFMPPIPDAPLALGILIIAETLTGAFLGLCARMVVSVMHVAGTIISYQSSLSLATFFDTSQTTQSTILGNFITITAVLVLFAFNVHAIMFQGLVDSYTLFTPGNFPPVDDFASLASQLLNECFKIAVQISAAHMVFGILLYLGAGILSRLMPTMQVFFVLMPPQIVLSFILLMALITQIMMTYSEFAEQTLRGFLMPGT